MYRPFLAAFTTLAGVAISVCACGSPSASQSPGNSQSPENPSGSQPAPAGYQIIGGPQQGVSLAVPSSWKAVEFPRDSVGQASAQLGLPSSSQQIYQANVLGPAAKLKALYALNPNAFVHILGKRYFGGPMAGKVFAVNINAYCASSGMSQQGAAGVAKIRDQVVYQLRTQPATVSGTSDVTLGGVSSLEVLYSPLSPGPPISDISAAQLIAMPAPGRICYSTLTSPGKLPAPVLNEIIASTRYY